jgi:hypothetical protein
MTTPQPIPCFGGPLDGQRVTISAGTRHECADSPHGDKIATYVRMRYGRFVTLADGSERLQSAYILVPEENLGLDFKIAPERHDELDWTPTDEEIIRQAEAEGKI